MMQSDMREKKYYCKNSILLRVFKRPDKAKLVLDAIRLVKPKKLYIACDGPKVNGGVEEKLVLETRRLVDSIDWDCDVKTLFWDVNLGGPKSGFEGINWFFKNEKQGIILEDDNLPGMDFFEFCDVMLEKYKNCEEVSAITGNNFQDGIKRGDSSYYFSKFPHCWGWAGWRRSWLNKASLEIDFWEEWKKSDDWKKKFESASERKYWERVFEGIYSGKKVHWDLAWTATTWFHKGLTVTPNVNLVTNIGFGDGATNTLDTDSPLSKIPLNKLINITHPKKIVQDKDADWYAFKNTFGGRRFLFPRSILNPIIPIIRGLKNFIQYNFHR